MKSSLAHFLLALVICVIAVIGYGVWYAAVAAKSAAVADLESRIAAKKETAARIASARASLADIAEEEAVIRNYFVPETGVVSFINTLEARGQTQRATVRVLSVSAKNIGGEPVLAFSLAVGGTFEAVMRTVGAIEYAPYALSVSSLSMKQDGTESWVADLGLLVGSAPPRSATDTP